MTIKGRCFCGATQFEIEAVPESVTWCTCSFCSRTGALWAYYTPTEIRFTQIEHDVVFAPNLNKHHFCAVCGITTYGESPSWNLETKQPDFSRPKLAINARLLEGIDLSTVRHETIDGRNLW